MRTATRIAVLTMLTALMMLLALPVLAVESGGGDDEAPATTEVVNFEYNPATIIEPPPPAEVDRPWTTKFLVPTGLALATVAVFVTVVQYFVRVVRSRYKVVE